MIKFPPDKIWIGPNLWHTKKPKGFDYCEYVKADKPNEMKDALKLIIETIKLVENRGETFVSTNLIKDIAKEALRKND